MPNRIYDNVLRAIRDCPAFREYRQGLVAVGRESGAGGAPAEAEQQEPRPATGDGESFPRLYQLEQQPQEQIDRTKKQAQKFSVRPKAG